MKGYSDELLLCEVDEMTNIAFEKESSYLEGKDDGIKLGIAEGREEGDRNAKREMARAMLADKLPIDRIVSYSGLSEEEIKRL